MTLLPETNGVLSYSLDRTGGLDGYEGTTVALDQVFANVPQWESAIRASFESWSTGTGFGFVEMPDSGEPLGAKGAQGIIRLTATELVGTTVAYCYHPPATGVPVTDLDSSSYGDLTYSTVIDWNATLLMGVTSHELGHALGLGHTLDPESVMYWTIDGAEALVPNAEDLADLRAIYSPLNAPAPILTMPEVNGSSDWFALADGTAETARSVTLTGDCRLITSGEQKTGVKGTGLSLAYETYGFDHVDLTLAEGGRIETDGANAYGIAADDYNTLSIDGTIVTAGSSSDGVALFGGGNLLSTSATSVIRTSGNSANGLWAGYSIVGGENRYLTNRLTAAGLIETSGNGAAGIFVYMNAEVTLQGRIATMGRGSAGIASDGNGFLEVDVQATGAITTTGERAYGIMGRGSANRIAMDGQITTSGDNAAGIAVLIASGNSAVSSGTIHTTGYNADGLYCYGNGNTLENLGAIATSGDEADGFYCFGIGNTLENSGTITTEGYYSRAFSSWGENNRITNRGTLTLAGESSHVFFVAGTGNQIENDGDIATARAYSYGILASGSGNQVVNTGRIATNGALSHGIVMTSGNVLLHSGSTRVSGADAFGIWTRDSDNTVDLSGTVLSAQAEAVRMGGDKDEATLAVLTTEATGNRLLLHGSPVIEGDIVNDGADNGAMVRFGATYDAEAAASYTVSPVALAYKGSFTGRSWVGEVLSDSAVVLNGAHNAFSRLTVDAGAFLGGTTTLSGSLVNGGAVSPGNSVGTLTVQGSYEQTTGGTLAIELGNGAQADALLVGGDATLASDSTVAVSRIGRIAGGSYAVLTTGGTFSGAPILRADNSALLRYSLRSTSDALLLEVDRTAYADLGSTANQRSAGDALDRVLPTASGPLADALLVWDGLAHTHEVQEVLSALSPSCYAALADEAFFAVRHLSTDAMLPPSTTEGGWIGHASYLPLQAKRHADADVSGYRIQGGALVGGVARSFGSLRLDLSLSYREGQISHDNRRARSETDGIVGALAARSDHGHWYVGGRLGGGRQWHDSWRTIVAPALAERAESEGAADLLFGGIEGGRRFRWRAWTIEPYLGLDYANFRLGQFAESGADGFDTTVFSATNESLRSSVGCRVELPVRLTPKLSGRIQGHLAWDHEFADSVVAYGADLAGERISVRGRAPGREQWNGGIALQVAVRKNVHLGGGIDYERQGADHGVVLRGSVVRTF